MIQPREVIDQKQMEADSGEVQSKATVKYGMDYRIFLLFALGIVIFEIYARNYRRKKRKTNYEDMFPQTMHVETVALMIRGND